jgi:ABC-type transport system involved in cytochrome c biogenesis ATPase subunit
VELVNFGMEDVIQKINEKMESLSRLAFTEISGLTTRYLRDVIRNEANTFDPDTVKNIDESGLRRIFASVDESVLGKSDQGKIYDVLQKINKDDEIKENERYVAHYISYLIEIGEKISDREKSVNRFVIICNEYLHGKNFIFRNDEYSVSIEYEDGSLVQMEDLSSGEKQIVSLFAHLILDDEEKNYVIIDEPELSLSVDWQQRFLQDISDLDTCHFIGAVTHSPFIFENSLDQYAIDLLSCYE